VIGCRIVVKSGRPRREVSYPKKRGSFDRSQKVDECRDRVFCAQALLSILGDIKLHRLFGVVIEPPEWGDLLHNVVG
jgi:hypothetical protein